MQRLILLTTIAIAGLIVAGCGNPFGDLKKLNGSTRAEAKSKLGEPSKIEKTVCEPAENASQMALTVAIPAGHPYEVWSYAKGDDTHLIYFADPSDAKSPPEKWKVVLTSTVKSKTLLN